MVRIRWSHGLEELGIPQGADLAPRGQQRGLDGVVGMVEVAQDPERDRHASVAGQTSQGVEGLSIALFRLDDQCCVHPPLRTEVLSRAHPGVIGLESGRGSLAVQSWAVASLRDAVSGRQAAAASLDACRVLEPDRLLDDLDPEQREAVEASSGPVAILAGAGTGKTRVISRRTAYAIATEAVPADQVLVVTFTDKAAGEMVERLRGLGLPGVTARTFHAHALSQLRPLLAEPPRRGAAARRCSTRRLPILGRLARQLPGHYRFTPAKDLADEIEWAKSRRIAPRDYEAAAAAAGREPPIPVDLFVRIYDDYERREGTGRADRLRRPAAGHGRPARGRRRGRGDGPRPQALVQRRRVPGHEPAPAAAARAVARRESRDVCVVGDEDQTIYTFTGATSDVPHRVR